MFLSHSTSWAVLFRRARSSALMSRSRVVHTPLAVGYLCFGTLAYRTAQPDDFVVVTHYLLHLFDCGPFLGTLQPDVVEQGFALRLQSFPVEFIWDIRFFLV